MSILGKLAKGTGYLACGLGGAAIGLTGNIVGGIGKAIIPESEFFDDIKEFSNKAGNAVLNASSSVGNLAEYAVDTTFKISGDIGGGIASGIAEMAGGSYEDIEKAKKIGRFCGGVVVGVIAGDLIGGAITSTAGMGAAGTGTSIASLHGAPYTSAIMAKIGGGTIASGGAGVAGGINTLTSINVICAADGGIKSLDSNRVEKSTTEQNFGYEIKLLDGN